MAKLEADGCDRILVLPLYPQYSSSTTGSALDAVNDATRGQRRVPALRVIDAYHDDKGYINALVQSVNEYWVRNGRPDMTLFSFHGVPRRTLELGDPYHCHCQKTARLVATELGLKKEQVRVTFQSRFGRARWLTPYTVADTGGAGEGGRSVGSTWCARGSSAIAWRRSRKSPRKARRRSSRPAAREFHYIPCLNERPAWIAALVDLAIRNLGGWLSRRRTSPRANRPGPGRGQWAPAD